MRAVNLLPDQHRRGPRQGVMANGAYIVVGLLAALLVMAVAYTLTSNQANERTSKAAEVKQEADRLEARANALGAFGSFAQIKQTRTASVKQLAAGRFDWERLLRELAVVLPSGGWIKEAKASVTGALEGQTAPTSAAAAKPTLLLTGCMRRQPEVAAFMVRLRKLYLVSDVLLNESTQAPTASAASVDNCGSLYSFDISVTFKATAPTGREAPEGRNSVPARLGGGS